MPADMEISAVATWLENVIFNSNLKEVKWSEVKSLSHVWLLATPWTAAYQAPLSMGFSRQEYWSGVPLPSPSQRRVMPKNFQTTIELHSFHMLERLCSKSFKLGFSSMWTETIQMYKLYLEKAEEPEVKLPTSVGSLKKQEFQKKHLLLFHWLC